jgi:hypothetical protein
VLAVLPLDDERLLSHLAEGEEPRVFVRQHPMVLLRPALWAVGGTVLWLWLAGSVPAGRLMDVLLVGVLGLWGWVAWSEAERRFNFIGVTDKRIFRTEGVFNRRYPAMRISKVTDVTLVRTVPGRIFRYSKIIIESAGQEQALHDLDYIPSPRATDLLWAELFGSRPRARRDRRRRRLPGLRRWRDDGGDDDWSDPDDGGEPPEGGPDGGTGGNAAQLPPGPVQQGDPRRTGGFLAEDDSDVPSAGDWRAHPGPSGLPSDRARRASGIRPGGESIYTSADRLPRTRRADDTGPIPISTRSSDR